MIVKGLRVISDFEYEFQLRKSRHTASASTLAWPYGPTPCKRSFSRSG